MGSLWRSPHDQAGHEQKKKGQALYIAVAFTVLAFGVQIYGSFYTGSIALLSDTAHLFTDTFSLALSIVAVKLSGRPPSHTQSYGLYRAEVLASFMNGLLLLLVAGTIAYESFERFFKPQEVLALPLLLISAAGLLLNLASAYFLHGAMDAHTRGHHHGTHAHHHEHTNCDHEHSHTHNTKEEMKQHEDRNLHSAFLHIISDALGSVAVMIGAVVIYYTHAYWVDAAIGVLLSCVVVYWSWKLIRETVHVLLESTPRHIQIPHVLQELKSVDSRVISVEDLHVWEITSRMYLLSVDVFVQAMPLSEADLIRKKMEGFLHERYGIAHPTIAMKQSPLFFPENS